MSGAILPAQHIHERDLGCSFNLDSTDNRQKLVLYDLVACAETFAKISAKCFFPLFASVSHQEPSRTLWNELKHGHQDTARDELEQHVSRWNAIEASDHTWRANGSLHCTPPVPK
jgi:hypothetical protein